MVEVTWWGKKKMFTLRAESVFCFCRPESTVSLHAEKNTLSPTDDSTQRPNVHLSTET